MDEILEQEHNEFVNSEDFEKYLKELHIYEEKLFSI
jgi:hypothetical protein